MSFAYEVSGLGLVSPLELAAARPLRRPPPGSWILARRGRPWPFKPPPPRGGLARIRLKDGSLAANWAGCGVFWIRPARRLVEFRLRRGAGAANFSDVVLGPLLSFLLVLGGVDPLHASAVEVDGGAVCFMGRPGAGKSTSAARFVLSGHRLLADDVLALERSGGRWRARPGHPEIRLWPASGQRLVADFERLPRVAERSAKRRLQPRSSFATGPRPVRAIYALEAARSLSGPLIEPLRGRPALLALLSNLYNPAFNEPALRERQLDVLSRAAAELPLRRLRVPRGRDHSAAVRELVLEDLRRLG